MIGYIYKIKCLETNEIYIGSTWKQSYKRRIIAHKNIVDIGCSSKYIINRNNYIFEILEENNFDNIKDRFKREQYYIDNNECINIHRAFVENKREYDNEQNRKYYNNNREKLILKRKEYRINNIEREKEIKSRKLCCKLCKKEMRFDNLRRHYNIKHPREFS